MFSFSIIHSIQFIVLVGQPAEKRTCLTGSVEIYPARIASTADADVQNVRHVLDVFISDLSFVSFECHNHTMGCFCPPSATHVHCRNKYVCQLDGWKGARAVSGQMSWKERVVLLNGLAFCWQGCLQYQWLF